MACSKFENGRPIPGHFLRCFIQTVFCVLQIGRGFEEICKQKETAFGISKQANFSKQIKNKTT
jgi:hypothetical protein